MTPHLITISRLPTPRVNQSPLSSATMSHQDIILPNASLFLVHKGWSPRRQRPQRGHAEVTSRSNLHPRGEKASLDRCNVKTFSQPWAPQIEANGNGNENDKDKQSSERRLGKPNAPRPFEFVNATRPDRPPDPRVRKFVMSHVKTGIKRGPNVQKTSKLKSTARYSKQAHMDANIGKEPHHLKDDDQVSVKLSPNVSGASSPLYGSRAFPLLTEPRSESLLNYYLYEVAPTWYPLEAHLAYNPVREGWFPLAIRDEFLFRAILFSSASHIRRKSGNRNLEEVTALVVPIFYHLNKRLQANAVPSETTISIVSCLAMVEISLGNYDNWKLHMTAIKEMVLLRGGLGNVGTSLQVKITRADIEGSSDTITMPNLPALPRSSAPMHSSVLDSSPYSFQENFLDRIYYKGISTEVQSILLSLFHLSHTLGYAVSCGESTVDPRSLDEDISGIHHDILTLLASGPASDRVPSSGRLSDLNANLNEATATAALLYAKSLSRGTRSIPTHPRPIIRHLASSLSHIHKNIIAEGPEKSHSQCPPGSSSLVPSLLLLWIHCIGGIAARGSEAEFFADGLIRCWAVIDLDRENYRAISSSWPSLPLWQDIKELLNKVLWFPLLYDGPGERFWALALRRSKIHLLK